MMFFYDDCVFLGGYSCFSALAFGGRIFLLGKLDHISYHEWNRRRRSGGSVWLGCDCGVCGKCLISGTFTLELGHVTYLSFEVELLILMSSLGSLELTRQYDGSAPALGEVSRIFFSPET